MGLAESAGMSGSGEVLPELHPGEVQPGNDRAKVGESLKLNLGCGNKILPGYVNVDYKNPWAKKKPDLECDIRKLPYGNDSVDEILAVHVIEHFHLWEAPEVIEEWRRVLKPGGKLILECPCLNKILHFFNIQPIVYSHTMMGLYGDQKYQDPAMVHKWCYSKEHLTDLMELFFRDVQFLPAQFHKPERDMRITGVK